jgi:DNA-binding IclR family transcriptional regulator
MVGSQTLDRGLRALALVTDADEPRSIQDLSSALGVHRSIAYRILRTLEEHRLVERDASGRYVAGVGLAVLSRSVRRSLQSTAIPELSDLAAELHMTAFLVVEDGAQAVTLTVVEPRHSKLHVAQRPGTRHAIDRGAPGIAILSGGPARPKERPAVAEARARGWATSSGEVIAGAHAVAAPIIDARGEVLGAIAVVYVDPSKDTSKIGKRLVRSARTIVAELA